MKVYGRVKLQHHSFITSVVEGVTYWLHTPAAFFAEEELPVFMVYKALWTPEPVYTLCSYRNSYTHDSSESLLIV
jgi:hypothetical protein